MASTRKPSQDSANPSERELAEALDRYTNPDPPEHDPVFAEEIRRLQPHWFDAPNQEAQQ
ncbi:MAG TPA: hypothetical protein VEL76_36995 [Gemmataceae bacterium]|nr:hypothetical protein [Gemmataceae bacterium]